jgi:hypothetical protein
VSADYPGASQSAIFWPGLTIFVPVSNEIALGADARALFAPGQDSGPSTLANNGTLKFPNTGGLSTPSGTAFAAGLTASYKF